MENAAKAVNIEELRALREGIRNRYNAYHKLDKSRFPAIDYNTSRANYEPLRASFEEEFYVVRGLDRFNNNLSVPSTNTLALLFSSDDYWPGKKILNTCRSYAEGKSSVAFTDVRLDDELHRINQSVPPAGRWWLVGLIVLAGFALYVVGYLTSLLKSAGLTISRPTDEQNVPRFLLVEGTVSNADTVWVVVHPVSRGGKYDLPLNRNKYYVQNPIPVDGNGIWKGKVHIGSADKSDIGIRSQIRAFVNPDKKYRIHGNYERYMFRAWPKAELSTDAIDVLRGPNETNK